MIQAFNSRERDLGDWEALLHQADERLQFVGAVQPFGSDMSILDVILVPGSMDQQSGQKRYSLE